MFKDFQTAEPADISLELNIVNKLPESDLEAAIADGTVIQPDEDVAGIYRMTSEDPATVVLTMPKGYLHKKTGYKIMNLIIPRLYYTAARQKRDVSSMIVHSCGIKRKSGVFLFCGPSETGKTTVARSCQAENGQVLNDEMNFIQVFNEERTPPVCCGLPIVGGIPEKSNLYGPLACIINLKQSKTTSYRTIQKTDAYLRLMRQIITSRDFYPSQDDLAAILERNAEFGERVINAVPCYEMEFTLDRESFWEEIDQLEAELPLKISTQAIS